MKIKHKRVVNISEIMEGYCFVMSVTDLNRSNTAKTDAAGIDNNDIYRFNAM
jgi:hypothetical protein